jgi:hypothetical protein
MARGDEPFRHGQAHGAEAEKRDLHTTNVGRVNACDKRMIRMSAMT